MLKAIPHITHLLLRAVIHCVIIALGACLYVCCSLRGDIKVCTHVLLHVGYRSTCQMEGLITLTYTWRLSGSSWKEQGMEYRVWSRVLLCYLLLSRYQKMDITQSLRQNLSDKTVVEYPTLHVCIAQSSTSARYIVFDQSMDYGMYAVARDTLYSVRYISFTNLINGWLFIIKSFSYQTFSLVFLLLHPQSIYKV